MNHIFFMCGPHDNTCDHAALGRRPQFGMPILQRVGIHVFRYFSNIFLNIFLFLVIALFLISFQKYLYK